MASAITDYLANAILDHIFGGVNYARPANVYIAALTTPAVNSDTGTSIAPKEATYTGYQRLLVSNDNINFPVAAGRAKTNGVQFLFAEGTAGSSVVTDIAICDAAADGNVLAKGTLSTPRTVSAGVILRIEPGDIQFTIDA